MKNHRAAAQPPVPPGPRSSPEQPSKLRLAGSPCVVAIHEGDVCVLQLLRDPRCYPRLEGLLREARAQIERGVLQLALDLTPAHDIDGASVGELVEIQHQLRTKGGCLRLTGLHPWVRHMLEISGVLRVVPVDETLARATHLRAS